ncbi:hypothetical protein JCM6292_2988 [Bacteroides pyogenes JCM 6292]|uniref:Uncharacterized protein n=2 Tax=Bacteroides pyogenes TaxID=310300 RepID=W4PJG6_9BACE|nr:hypothetical protein JCM6292_2988 [Bacteroides pyogenes JCM 6292]GAE19941.1 hypothetical protein JCM6294_3061 [Bacteroides pyogenes DSM 20611 = JCM 6294]
MSLKGYFHAGETDHEKENLHIAVIIGNIVCQAQAWKTLKSVLGKKHRIKQQGRSLV